MFQICCQLNILTSHPHLPPAISKYSWFSAKMQHAVLWPCRPLQCHSTGWVKSLGSLTYRHRGCLAEPQHGELLSRSWQSRGAGLCPQLAWSSCKKHITFQTCTRLTASLSKEGNSDHGVHATRAWLESDKGSPAEVEVVLRTTEAPPASSIPWEQVDDSRASTSFLSTWFSQLPDHTPHRVCTSPALCRLRVPVEEPECGAGAGVGGKRPAG